METLQNYTVKESSNGKNFYYNSDGIFHRTDGPAIEYPDGSNEWYLNGKRHREDGPAIDYVSGYKEWRIDGALHRLDGPAVIYSNGSVEYYILDKEVPEEEFNQLSKLLSSITSDYTKKQLNLILNVITKLINNKF